MNPPKSLKTSAITSPMSLHEDTIDKSWRDCRKVYVRCENSHVIWSWYRATSTPSCTHSLPIVSQCAQPADSLDWLPLGADRLGRRGR